MGLLTINLPDHVIKELRQVGAYVPDLILRAVVRELENRARANSSSATTKNIEVRSV